MFCFSELYMFTKTRFGQNLLVVAATLVTFTYGTAVFLSAHNRAMNTICESNQDEANGRAIKEALGFSYTGLYDGWGDTYVNKGIGILFVEPNGPFDQAGLKRGDRIPPGSRLFKTLLIKRRGGKVVVPVVRAGRRFNVTVTIPRFTVPFPELVSSAPVSPGH